MFPKLVKIIRTLLLLRPYLSDNYLHQKLTALNRVVEGAACDASFALASDKSKEELEAMATSFHFNNCNIDEEAKQFVTDLVSITKQNISQK